MHIKIAAGGSPKELAKLFRGIAEAFEETEEKKDKEKEEIENNSGGKDNG